MVVFPDDMENSATRSAHMSSSLPLLLLPRIPRCLVVVMEPVVMDNWEVADAHASLATRAATAMYVVAWGVSLRFTQLTPRVLPSSILQSGAAHNAPRSAPIGAYANQESASHVSVIQASEETAASFNAPSILRVLVVVGGFVPPLAAFALTHMRRTPRLAFAQTVSESSLVPFAILPVQIADLARVITPRVSVPVLAASGGRHVPSNVQEVPSTPATETVSASPLQASASVIAPEQRGSSSVLSVIRATQLTSLISVM